MQSKHFVLILLSLCRLSFSDHAKIARPGALHLKLGFDYLYSSENFASDGVRENINFLNQSVDISTNTFWIQPEFGFGNGWAAHFKMRGWTGNANPVSGASTVATGSGVGDLDLALERTVMDDPQSVLEVVGRLAPYQSVVGASDLVAGDGSIDFGVFYHIALPYDRFRFLVSPGVVARANGYAPLIKFFAGAEVLLEPGYIRFYIDSQMSIGSNGAYANSLSTNLVAGSGGSFSRLSGAPTGIDLGLKAGVEMTRGYFIEGYFSHSVWGTRYPNSLILGINLHAVLDLNPKDTGLKLREVPLDKPVESIPP